ncbi:hypothetical protein [Saccharopolyspora sp. NPDC003762]
MHVRHDEYTAGVAIELDCGTVIDAPNDLTLAWLMAKHQYEEESGDWSKLNTRQKCERLASTLDMLAALSKKER